jgi:hypothetical protein
MDFSSTPSVISPDKGNGSIPLYYPFYPYPNPNHPDNAHLLHTFTASDESPPPPPSPDTVVEPLVDLGDLAEDLSSPEEVTDLSYITGLDGSAHVPYGFTKKGKPRKNRPSSYKKFTHCITSKDHATHNRIRKNAHMKKRATKYHKLVSAGKDITRDYGYPTDTALLLLLIEFDLV